MDLIKIKDRLTQLGYTATAGDDAILTYIGTTVEVSTKRVYNLAELPAEAENIIIDKVVGEFILLKKGSGADLGNIITTAVTEKTEGDTTVKMDKSATPAAQLDTLINWLIHGRDGVLLTYRSMTW